MKAFKINTEAQQVEEIQINTWKDIAPAIGNGCRCFSIPVIFDNEDSIHCDDEGLFNTIEGGFMMKDWSYPIVGNSLLIGSDEEGEMVDVKTTKEELEKSITWVSKKDAEAWADLYR